MRAQTLVDPLRQLAARTGAVVLGLALFGGAPLSAQAPTTFNACFVPAVGALYLIGLAGLPSACLGNHVAVSWTEGGALADGAVTTDKIADGAVTAEKLAAGLGSGTVTSVTAGTGLTGGTITTIGTLSVDLAGPGSATTVARSDHTHAVSSTNIGVGNGALLMNTTGSQNTAVGSNALRNNSTGTENAAFGAGSMDASAGDAGSYNTAIGGFTLRATTGDNNTAVGSRALTAMTSGQDNTGVGRLALSANQTGTSLTAVGSNALASNLSQDNTAVGTAAMALSTTGGWSTAVGAFALRSASQNFNTAIGWGAAVLTSSGNSNTALGYLALSNNGTGSRNIAIGANAGADVTTGSDNIHIGNIGAAEAVTIRIGTAGTHTRAFLAGVRGVTTGTANGIAVLIDGNGQLGTVSSSERYKEDIRDLADASAALMRLRPVVFRYREPMADGSKPEEFGLIAEQVAETFPALVVHDSAGRPETVRYHVLPVLLLNELQRQERELNAVRAELSRLSALVAEQAAALAALRAPGGGARP
jgi:hypothetical protein